MGYGAINQDDIEIAAELVHELDADGKQLRVVKLTDDSVPRSRERESVVGNRVRIVGGLDTLHFFDNSSDTPRLIFKDEAGKTTVNDAALYEKLRAEFEP